MLSSAEQSILVILGIITVSIFVYNFIQKDYLKVWSPLTIISLIFFYYVIVGPVIAVYNDETYFRFTEHRPYILSAWELSLVGLIGILVGFMFSSKKFKSQAYDPGRDSEWLTRRALWLYGIGIAGLAIFVGLGGVISQLTFWDIYSTRGIGYGGAFKNYFLHAIDFFIPALVLLFIGVLNKRISVIWFLILLGIAIAVYTKQGFRWRYVVLGLSLIISFYSFRKKKPSTALIVSITVIGILVMGIIGLTRNYGRGLEFSNIEGKTNEEIFMEGFGESSVFMTTGLLVNKVPDEFNYIGMDPLIQAITMPIPRIIWPDKPSGDYINIYENIYGSKQFGFGAAVINFGEYYLAFGFAGVIIGGFMIGFFYKRFWSWFQVNAENPYAITFYSIGVSFLYVIISRGYLPQVTMLFFFTVFPSYIIYRINFNKLRKIAFYDRITHVRDLNSKKIFKHSGKEE